MDVSSNSVELGWFVGANGGGGENITYVITINNRFNVTTDIEHLDEELENLIEPEEASLNTIQIRGLHANQVRLILE